MEFLWRLMIGWCHPYPSIHTQNLQAPKGYTVRRECEANGRYNGRVRSSVTVSRSDFVWLVVLLALGSNWGLSYGRLQLIDLKIVYLILKSYLIVYFYDVLFSSQQWHFGSRHSDAVLCFWGFLEDVSWTWTRHISPLLYIIYLYSSNAAVMWCVTVRFFKSAGKASQPPEDGRCERSADSGGCRQHQSFQFLAWTKLFTNSICLLFCR